MILATSPIALLYVHNENLASHDKVSLCHMTSPRRPAGSIIMYGAMLLFESEFVHIVAISFTSLILTELLMVALTIQTWHWLMIVAELLSLSCYIASLVFLHGYIGEEVSPRHRNYNTTTQGFLTPWGWELI